MHSAIRSARLARNSALSMALVALMLTAFVSLPSSALAEPITAEDQYAEHIPSPGGDRPTKNLGGGNSGAIDPATAEELAGLGADGVAVRDLLEQTRVADRSSRNASTASGADSENAETALGGVGEALIGGSGNGMGILLPLVLIVVAIAAAAAVILNRRGQAGSGSA